jgi:glyoxylase-like metal-dependent hydrolase (beta-lactamase superfamily II)
MRTWKTKNGCKIIQVLSGRSNAYLIIINNNIILVDTGKRSSFAALLKKLDSMNITCADIMVLILTHTHFDHCQSAKEIKEKSDCKVIASRIAEDSIKNGYTKLSNGTFFITKLIARLGLIIGKRKFGFEPFQQDIFVEGKYDLDIANSRITIIETQGHSSDSVSILIDNEVAIVGDAMFGVFNNSIFPPYSDDVVKMIKSWGKLLHTDCAIFLPGHGKEIGRNLLQKEYEKYARKYNTRHTH